MWLLIRPNDALFMRDGRPFDAGADAWAGHIFPPYPPTCYGMTRTLLTHQVSPSVDYADFFKHVPEPYKKLLGDKDRQGDLASSGPFLGKKEGEVYDLYAPRPADLFFHTEDKDKKERGFYILQPDPNGQRLNDFSDAAQPFLKLSFSPDMDAPEEPEPESCFIGGEALKTYLMGQASNSHLLDWDLEDLWQEEPSTIIERDDNTLTAKEHQLAHPSYIRMERDAGLLIQIDDAHASLFETGQAARLGGECRVCFVERRDVEPIVDLEAMAERIMAANGRFKALLTSPGYFPKNGCFPDFLTDIDSQDGKKVLPEGEWDVAGKKKKVQLKTMACGRADRVAGWDLAKGRPKTMIKAVPAGAVYFFEIKDFDKERDKDWIETLTAASFPGAMPGGDDNCVRQGFNTILIGGWDYVS